MRVTVLFFLIACILALTIWIWNITPSRLEVIPIINARAKYDDLQKISKYTDIELLRQHAINLVHNADMEKYERDMTTIKAANLTALTVALAITCQVILFFEIAARGRKYRERKEV